MTEIVCSCGKKWFFEAGHSCCDTPETAELRVLLALARKENKSLIAENKNLIVELKEWRREHEIEFTLFK